MSLPVRIIEPGERFGALTVIKRRDAPNTPVYCLCECGTEVTIAQPKLLRGRRDRCTGHYRRGGQARKSHGMTATQVYAAWRSMRSRCENPKHPNYKDYGGRGIKVCDRWSTSFDAFLVDMGEPEPHLSLDRIDNNGNYEPGNCRWATGAQQRANRRRQVARCSKLTHCKRGHPFDEVNTMYVLNGRSRVCRRCRSDYYKAQRAARRAARSTIPQQRTSTDAEVSSHG